MSWLSSHDLEQHVNSGVGAEEHDPYDVGKQWLEMKDSSVPFWEVEVEIACQTSLETQF